MRPPFESDAYEVLGFDVSVPGRCVGRFALAASVRHHVGVVTEREYRCSGRPIVRWAAALPWWTARLKNRMV